MIYATVVMIIGYTMTQVGGSKLFAAVGLALFMFGMIAGSILEDRLDNKIKSLEKELKEMEQNEKVSYL